MVNDTAFKSWEKKVVVVQNWNREIIEWAPDSSPEAWGHFQKYYTVEHWPLLKLYGNEDFAASEKLFFYDKEVGFYSSPKVKHEALFSPQIEVCCNRCSTCVERKSKGKKLLLRLRGETDFDFKEDRRNKNKNKYKRLEEIIECTNPRKNESEYAKELLNKCKNMHYTLLNFSLMQSVGNMQTIKSKGLRDPEKNNYEWLDRLDTFVYHLNAYYKDRKDNAVIFDCATKSNKECLKFFLDTFSDIYEYCDKVYFIKIGDNEKCDDDFIQRLIKSGGKILSSCDDVVEYMELAIEFWQRKQKYFESID